MKKLLFALVMLVTIQLGAQPKEVSDALKALDRAKSASENAKRATNPKTWTTLASAYMGVYEAPIKSIWLGASRVEIKVLLKDQRIENTETVTIGDVVLTVDHYADKKLYYNEAGELAAWVIKENYVDIDPLDKAFESIVRASEVDDRGRSTKEITELMQSLKGKYFNEAMSKYTLGKFDLASIYFEKAADVSSHKILNSMDTVLIYYAGLTAFMVQDFDRAIRFFNKAIANGYDVNGDAFSYLAEAYKAKGDIEKTKEVLNAGFRKYPSTQSILVSLINTYLESNDDPEKILELIHQAQKNEPNNPTLFYAEGNVWKNLNNIEKAIETYSKSVEIDPGYYFGFFAIGTAYYDKAVEISNKAAEELDDAKYEALVAELEKNLEAAIEPFEKCFNATEDAEIKQVVAEYLKNIFFRFREKGDDYKANYEKYNSFASGSGQ